MGTKCSPFFVASLAWSHGRSSSREGPNESIADLRREAKKKKGSKPQQPHLGFVPKKATGLYEKTQENDAGVEVGRGWSLGGGWVVP